MFVAQAHSFTQQARLAITLAWVAGYTNTLTIITCASVTSHVSGTASNLGRYVASGSWPLAASMALLLLTFLCGALVSGLCTEFGRRRGWESVYVLPIAVEAVLLSFFAVGLEFWGDGTNQGGLVLHGLISITSFAMGLQNATITRISSGIVRTTHVTGVLTDLGLEMAQFILWARDRDRRSPTSSPRARLRSARVHPTGKRLALLASIVGSFTLGAGLGELSHEFLERLAMFPAVMFLIWLIYRDVTIPIAEIGPSDVFAAEHGLQLPAALAIYHVGKEQDRRGRAHRMPNLQAWADRLPAETRVVVLDLGHKSTFDSNSVLELRAVLNLFAQQNRRLVIAGLGSDQFRQIRQVVPTDFLDPSNCCPDLELAIARALTLIEVPRSAAEAPQPTS